MNILYSCMLKVLLIEIWKISVLHWIVKIIQNFSKRRIFNSLICVKKIKTNIQISDFMLNSQIVPDALKLTDIQGIDGNLRYSTLISTGICLRENCKRVYPSISSEIHTGGNRCIANENLPSNPVAGRENSFRVQTRARYFLNLGVLVGNRVIYLVISYSYSLFKIVHSLHNDKKV